MKKIRVLDLDGCISDDRWRLDRIQHTISGRARYHDYHMLSSFDELVNEHLVQTPLNIVIVTGRPEEYRSITTEWLIRNDIAPLKLVMRPNGNFQRAVDFKRVVLTALLNELGWSPDAIEDCYDDRADIVVMYCSLGLTAYVQTIHDAMVKLRGGV